MRISYCVYKRTLTQYALRNTQNSASCFSVFRASFENLIQGRQVRLKAPDELLAGLLGERLVRVLSEGLQGASVMLPGPPQFVFGTLCELLNGLVEVRRDGFKGELYRGKWVASGTGV